jgi:hypothetical protein
VREARVGARYQIGEGTGSGLTGRAGGAEQVDVVTPHEEQGWGRGGAGPVRAVLAHEVLHRSWR